MSPFSTWWRRRQIARTGRSLESLLTDGFVAIDLETTGLDSRRDAIVEVAAVPFLDGRPGPVYATHVNPGRPIPPESIQVHGIDDSMVTLAPAIGDVLRRLDTVCDGRVLVGHGIDFDLAVLARERRVHGYAPTTNVSLDTMRLAKALRPEWATFDLEGVAARLGIGVLGRHTAEGDARAAGEILLLLIPEIKARGVRSLDDLDWLLKSPGRLG